MSALIYKYLMEKYVVIAEESGEPLDEKILDYLDIVPEIKIGDHTSFSCDVEIREEYLDILRDHLKTLGAALHKLPIVERIKPFESSLETLREDGLVTRVSRLPKKEF